MGGSSWGCFLHSTCLQPTYSLRRQLFFSFGATGILTTSLVVALACACAISAGNLVREEAQKFMRQEVIDSISNSSLRAADTLSQELDHLRGTVALIAEIVRDRIAGYPQSGWDEDLFVPFPTYPNEVTGVQGNQQENQYPLKSPLLPRDWNVPLNVNSSNYEEHALELFVLLHQQQHEHHAGASFAEHALPRLSTASAVYSFQGTCDPSAAETDPTYYPNCTGANNNGTTGGVVWPTPTSSGLEQRAADIGVFLKPIWESRNDILQVSVHFVNEGAGSMVHFPSFVHQNSDNAYESIGCDWLYENKNPRTGRPFLTEAQTAKCKPNGTSVPRREANPLETDWCRDQALHPDETRFYGPFQDEFFRSGGLEADQGEDIHVWVVRAGRAIFDRYTGEFIGCIALDVLTNRWTELIIDSLQVQNHSEAIVVRANDGIVVAGGGWHLYNSHSTVHATETGVVPTASLYDELREGLNDLSQEMNRKEQRETADAGNAPLVLPVIVECTTGRVLSASVIAGSEFLYIQAVNENIFDIIDVVEQEIQEDVFYSTIIAISIGGASICLLLIVLYLGSMSLTQPLIWVQQVAWTIVNHRNLDLERQSSKVLDFYETLGSGPDSKCQPRALRCNPKTEITDLVREFKEMIQGFSGKREASTVAMPVGHEVHNTLAWYNVCDEKRKQFNVDSNVCIDSDGRNATDTITHNKLQSSSTTCSSSSSSTNASGDDGSCEKQSYDSVSLQTDVVQENAEMESCLFRSVTGPPNNVTVVGTADEKPQATANGTTFTTTRKKEPLAASLSASKSECDSEWRNRGRNISPPPMHSHNDPMVGDCNAIKSSLFRWIFLLIVVPMVVTNAIIAAAVSLRVLMVLPVWLGSVEETSYDIQLEDMTIASKFASKNAEAFMATPVRDLFLINQVAEWMFTGAISREENAFVSMRSGAEECKMYDTVGECPYFDDKVNNAPCDCSWEKPQPKECVAYEGDSDTRRMQRLFFAAKRSDADPQTGDRERSSFPLVDASARNTSWWQNILEMPGASKGSRAAGHKTTFDRVKVMSALSTIIFPIYNYRTFLVHSEDHRFMGVNIGFEADGMLAGWTGCSQPTPRYPHWRSTVSNFADKLRPDLCPLGSYGYDSRCREWYAAGKEAAVDGGRNTSLFVTAPYYLARGDVQASSATQALVDPKTGEHFGQALVDFLQFDMNRLSLGKSDDRFHVVITPSLDVAGGDTVIGPDLKEDAPHLDDRNSIGRRILQYDRSDSTNRREFERNVLHHMKLGHPCFSGQGRSVDHVPSFTRTVHQEDDHGNILETEEALRMVYDPIHIRALGSVQTDNFSRGLTVSKPLVYSIGIVRSEASLEKAFEDFQRDAGQRLQRDVVIYMTMIALVSLVATLITCWLALSVTRPVIILLSVVRNINDGLFDDGIPPLLGGSREVNQVYTSFAKLYKIVRVSNSAFFSKNLSLARHLTRDALKLFSKINDRKAIAIASSNLGSTLFAMNCGRIKEARCLCLKLDGMCCVDEAAIHLETAVESAKDVLSQAVDLPSQIELSEQLADRLFNRGLYFLLCSSDPCAKEDFEELGLQDLRKTRALDQDVYDYWIAHDLLPAKASTLFERILRRLNGLCALLENGIDQNIWDFSSLADDCYRLLTNAWEDPQTTMFEEYSPIGRLQQLEGVLIQLHFQRDKDEAARIAFRMLVEDEYVNEKAFQNAAAAVLQQTDGSQPLHKFNSQDTTTRSSLLSRSVPSLSQTSAENDIQRMLKSCRQRSSNKNKKCIVFCLDLCDEKSFSTDTVKIQLVKLYDSVCDDADYFGLATPRGMQMSIEPSRQMVEVHKKRIRSAVQAMEINPLSSFNRAISSINPLSSTGSRIDLLTMIKNGTRPCKVLPLALDTVLESDVCAHNDTYLLHITDSFKRNYDSKSITALKLRIEEATAKRKGDIHLIAVDLDHENEKYADFMAAPSIFRTTQRSAYIETSLETLEENMSRIRNIMLADTFSTGTYSNALMSGITMEKF